MAGRGFSILVSVLALAATMLVSGPLRAQQNGPALFGSRDFEMDWLQAGSGRALRLRFFAARRILRIEALDGSGQVVLRDLEKGDVLVLVGEGQRGVYGQRGAPLRGLQIIPGDGRRTIAGEECREASAGSVAFCLTDDMIPLAMTEGGQEMMAQRLLRQPQNPALFTVPKETKILPMPGNSGAGYAGSLPGVPF